MVTQMSITLRAKLFRAYGFLIGTLHPESTSLEICEHKKESLTRQEQPPINKLREEGRELQEGERKRAAWLDENDTHEIMPQPNHALECAAGVMALAAATLVYFTLAPFAAAAISLIVAVGLVIPTALGFHFFLTSLAQGNRVVFSVVCTLLVAGLLAHGFLACVRSEIFKHLINHEAPVSIEDDSSVTQKNRANDSERRVTALFDTALPLASFALEGFAGLAWYEALRRRKQIADVRARILAVSRVKAELESIRERLKEVIEELTMRTELPHIFEKEFLCGMLHARGEGERRARAAAKAAESEESAFQKKVARWVPIALLLVVLFVALATRAFGESETEVQRVNLVMVLDLSESRKAKGSDGKVEFEQDLHAAEKVLRQIPLGAAVTVLGVTGNGLNPYLILKATVANNPGVFEENIAEARARLVEALRTKGKSLVPKSKNTALFGTFYVASEILVARLGDRKILLVLSDMQQDDDHEFDFEAMKRIPESLFDKAEREGLIPNLRNVEVYCIGVTAQNKSIQYWNSLRQFWTVYFKKAGADLKAFTISREFNFGRKN